MILFLDDWRKYPNAIIDTKTKNITFIRMAEVLRRMGVKNNSFVLALTNPMLQGVDPYDPNITLEQKAMIAMEARDNPWYYLREVCRIPAQAGPVPSPFLMNRGNLALFFCFLCHVTIILLQPRQTGKSVGADSLMNWLLHLGARNTTICMTTLNNTLRVANVDRLKEMRDLLPEWLVYNDSTDANNQTIITYNALENEYRTSVSQAHESGANNVGRGATSPIFHIDEAPFIKHIGTMIPAALAAGTAAREEARRNNSPWGTIYTTTAGRIDDRDGRFIYDMLMDAAFWNERFMDARNIDEFRAIIARQCQGHEPMVHASFSHRMLGKTDEWLKRAMAEARSSGDKADRDFFLKWTRGTQMSPLTIQQNNTIYDSEEEPHAISTHRHAYTIRWYIADDAIDAFMRNGRFVIGMDTSEAVGRDAITLVLSDTRTLAVVAVGTFNETNLHNFATFLAEFMIRYTNTTLVIERKSTGQAILDTLFVLLSNAGHNPFKRIYNYIMSDKDEYKSEYQLVTKHGFPSQDLLVSYKNRFGFNTNAANRELLYGIVLQNAAKVGGHLVKDKQLSAEIRGLVTKNGRIDHSASGHDDHVIAWLLTHWFMTLTKNFHLYGISAEFCMTDITTSETSVDPLEKQRVAQLRLIKGEIDEIIDRLKTQTSPTLIAKLEHQIKIKTHEYNSLGGESDVYNIDAVLKEAAMSRTKKHMSARKSNRGPLRLNWNRI